MNPIIQMYPLVKRACLYNLAIHHGHVRGRASLAREAFCSPIPSAYYNNFHLFHLLRVFISLGAMIPITKLYMYSYCCIWVHKLKNLKFRKELENSTTQLITKRLSPCTDQLGNMPLFSSKQMVLSAYCKVTNSSCYKPKTNSKVLQLSQSWLCQATHSVIMWRNRCTRHTSGRMSPSIREADLSHSLALIQGSESKGLKPPLTSQELNWAS